MSWFNKLTGKIDGQDETEVLDARDEDVAAGDGDGDGELAIDVYQDKDNVIVRSTIAGVSPEDFDISINGSEVTIRGERKNEREVKEDDYLFQECYWGSFSRTFALPVEVDADKARADIKDGILTLTLPKAGKNRTRKVKVRGEEE